MEHKEQKCPLCGEVAKYKMIANNQSKHFNCKNCTEFIVTIEAEEILKDKDFTESTRRRISSDIEKLTNKTHIALINCPKNDDILIEPKTDFRVSAIERHTDFW